MSAKIYHYVLFLKHPETHDCVNQHIEIDADGKYMDAHELFKKLHEESDVHFDKGYVLIGLNISNIEETE